MGIERRFQEIQEMFREQREELENLKKLIATKPREKIEKTRTLEQFNKSALSFLSDFIPNLIPFSFVHNFKITWAQKRISRAWQEFRFNWEEQEVWIQDKPMHENSGYFLFAFRIPEAITGRLEIGFTRFPDTSKFNYRQNVQFVTSTGLIYQAGNCQRIPDADNFFAACETGDTITLAVTVGTGLVTILNTRLAQTVVGPLGIDLPIVGEVFPVIRAYEEFFDGIEVVVPSSAPLISECFCEHEWITSGPLLPGYSATLAIDDLEEACCVGLTTAVGAAACAAQLPVQPIWQVDFISGVISETSETRRTTRKFSHSARIGNPVVISNHGNHVTVEFSENIIKFEISEQIFIIAEGLTLEEVDYE